MGLSHDPFRLPAALESPATGVAAFLFPSRFKTAFENGDEDPAIDARG